MTVFPKSYVDPKTKRLHPKFWINQNGRWKRRFHEAVALHGREFCRAATPHVVYIGDTLRDDGAWEVINSWMTDNVNHPWYFWTAGKEGDFIAFADVSDAVHFRLWAHLTPQDEPKPNKEVDHVWRADIIPPNTFS